MHAQVMIENPIDQVWNFLIEQLATSYGSIEELEGKEITMETLNFLAQRIQVKQRVSKLIENQSIQLETTSTHDLVSTIFELKPNEAFTILTLQEEAQASSKQYRLWNYKLMALPLLRRGAMRKLQERLNRMKQMIERS